MANLAIQGHATRGREVIKLLEMLGGKNKQEVYAIRHTYIYFINECFINFLNISQVLPEQFVIYSLEEFLEKFPYKVGDKVTHNAGILMNVVRMYWDSECNVVRYDIQSPIDNNYKLKAMLAEHLQPYKEETMEEKPVNHVFDVEVISFDIAQKDSYELDLKGEFEVILREGKYYVERIKPQYPKTYEECCKILGIDHMFLIALEDKEDELIIGFVKLRRCRNAYWKIAGEQMGLGKPWKQDYDDRCFIIANNEGNIHTYEYHGSNNVILTFPTKEMRDAFYENFKDLIENCKELL